LRGNKVPNFTLGITPWGLDNRTPIRSSIPGTISVRNPTQPAALGLGTGGANALGRNCTNCWAFPSGVGQPFSPGASGIGPTAPYSASTLNWATFAVPANGGATNPAGGTANEFNPYTI